MNPAMRIIGYYRRQRPVTLLWHHGLLFFVCGALIVLARIFWLPWMPVFWPLLVWYVLFSLHFLLVRSLTANDEWADERADKIRRQAYDFQHVKDIYIQPTNLETPSGPRRRPQKSSDGA